MVDATTLATIDLKAPEAQDAVRRIVHETVQFGEARAAFTAAKVLAGRIKGDAALERQYAESLAMLKATALPLLSDEGAVTVFGEYLPTILAHPDVDLIHGLRMKTIGMPDDELRRFYAGVMNAIAAAQTALTEKPLRMEDGTARPPTLAGWTAAVRAGLEGSSPDAVAASSLLAGLSDDERTKALRLIHLIDVVQRIARGDAQPEDIVIREKDGAVKVVSGGSVLPIAAAPVPPPPAAPAPTPAPISAAVPIPAAPAQRPAQAVPVRVTSTPAAQPAAAPLPARTPTATTPPTPAPTPQPRPTPLPVPARPAPAAMQSVPGSAISTQYSLEDEEEIQKQTERLRDLNAEPSADEVLDARVRALISQQQLTFADDNLRRRFGMLVKTYIKGIRNSIETEEILQRPPKVGGMGYTAAQASEVVQSAGALIAQRAQHEGVRELVKEAKQQEGAGRVPEPPSIPVPAVPVIPVAPPNPIRVMPQPAQAPIPQAAAQPAPQPAPAAQPKFSERVEPKRPFLRRLQQGRRSFMDSAAPKKLAGPEDQIRSMQLGDFRKLGGTPQERIQKLYAQFVALGKESFAMRMKGVAAWRKSPVYQAYLELGMLSMQGGKSIADIIAEQQRQGKDTLSEEEFHYIADLNRQLQFA